MNYIKIDHSYLEEGMGNYVYLLELNDNNMVEREIITNISKDQQEINKSVWGDASGRFKWEKSKFNDSEIANNRISKEEFDKYW